MYVIARNSTGWSNYSVKLSADNNASVFHQNIQPGNATKIDLAQLDPDSVHRVQVTPVQVDGEELERWTNDIDFRTRASEWWQSCTSDLLLEKLRALAFLS